jgi:hypothetical protein
VAKARPALDAPPDVTATVSAIKAERETRPVRIVAAGFLIKKAPTEAASSAIPLPSPHRTETKNAETDQAEGEHVSNSPTASGARDEAQK